MALREKCPNTELFLVTFSCIWTEQRKKRTRNNSVFGQFSHRVGVTDSLIPSQAGIQKIAIVSYVTNGKTSEIRLSINKFYPNGYSQRKNEEFQWKFIDERNIITNI